ncbi:P-loop NTPase fold protein [Pedobacter gandavensis]|uniref:P-loop NTPase fold protein n=1 Tax=Pedobacter gandavensis TaxID=2679963 RepID=UPI00292D6BE6|nr:P-loop NTPase fold protein [Pedobacter gandavensis]
MTKLTSTINILHQKIRSRRIADTSILLFIFLAAGILFNQFFIKKFDTWVTFPLLSTIKSSLFIDCFWVVFFIAIIVSIINFQTRRFLYSRYWFPAGLFFVVTYLYFRFVSDHYNLVGFELLQGLKYADIFTVLTFLVTIICYSNSKKKVRATTSSELKQVQRMIHSYLDIETNYALLLNGKRGTGKTHFVKDRLLDQISNTRLEGSTKKYYIPIYISLYGLTSIEEIYLQMSMTLTPHLKSETLPNDPYLSKILLRGMLNITSAGNIDDFLKDFQKARKNNISFGDFVIIFDDLDRISKDLTISELIGFINSMVEHENNKVIIVADEDEVLDQPLYKEVREKTIGSIVEYPESFETTFDEIILSKYSIPAPEFHEHLKLVKDTIHNQFQIGKCVSLRTLIYFLNHYKKVYESLDNNPKRETREIDVQQRKMNLTLRFTCAVCIEFKSGLLSYHSKQGIEDMVSINKKLTDDFTIQMWRKTKARLDNEAPNALPLEEMKYSEQFVTKYFRMWEYHFLKSAYDFVTGGNELDQMLLISELQFIDDAIAPLSEAESVYNELSMPQVFDLSNEEYKILSEKMLTLSENGDYPLKKYLDVFAYLERFPAIAEYPSNILAERLTNALKDNQSKFSYDSDLDFTLREVNRFPENSDWKLLKDTLREVNNATEALNEERRAENLYDLFLLDPDEFYDRCRKEFYDRPVFHTWDFPTFYNDFLNLKPSAIPSFTWFMRTRYKHAGNEDWIEKHFIEDLINKLSTSEEEVNFKQILIEELRETLHGILTSYIQISFAESRT